MPYSLYIEDVTPKHFFQEGTTMLATVKQTTLDQVGTPEPTVTYQPLTINATVIVSPPATVGGQPIFDAPMITIPGSGSALIPAKCIVIWTLVDGSNAFTNLTFGTEGIVFSPEAPEGFTVSDPMVGETPNQYKVTIENQVTGTNAFSYTISISYALGAVSEPLPAFHDPTIVVTLDPLT